MASRRPPTPTQLDAWARDLAELHHRLADPATAATLRTIWDATQDHYPSRHGAPPTRSTTGTSPTETAATQPRRQPVAVHAERVLDAAHQLHTLTRLVLNALDEWDPTRPVTCCPRCGHPLDRGVARCQHVDERGVQCGQRPEATPCRDCGSDVPRGQIRRGLCDACRKHRDRHGRARVATIGRLHLDGVIVDGAYTG